MTWNYRAVRHVATLGVGQSAINPSRIAIHKVHYDVNGDPESQSDPVTFSCEATDGPDGLIAELMMAVHGVGDMPILDCFLIGCCKQ